MILVVIQNIRKKNKFLNNQSKEIEDVVVFFFEVQTY
jgi:hypothetical protein